MAKPSRKSRSEPVATLRFWGVRGSTPTVDKATWRYGGNTPCLELTTPAGGRVILDCGTGLRMLGRHLESAQESKRIETHVFVTHYHWDHIQGIPFFSPWTSARCQRAAILRKSAEEISLKCRGRA